MRKIERATEEVPGALDIKTDEQFEVVGAMLNDVVALEREVDATFDPILKRQNEALREAREQKKRHRAPLEALESAVKKALAGWVDRRKRLSIEDQVMAPPEDRDDEGLAVVPTPPPRPSSVAAVREAWKFTILDPDALSREVLQPDATAIRRRVLALGDAAVESCSLPGKKAIKVWKETQVAASRRSS